MRIKNHLLTFLILFTSTYSMAGIFELSLSNSYVNMKINAVNYTTRFSTTSSFSYYFMEMSALEFSYTEGKVVEAIGSDVTIAPTIYTTLNKTIGIDLVWSFAGRESRFQPFIKFGGAERYKEKFLKPSSGLPQSSTGSVSGAVPSAGVGLRMKLTKAFSLKFSADAWGSSPEEKFNDWDVAYRIGVSWFL
jgi:hypothetical protein